APCYQSHALRWRLLGADDKPVADEVVFPRVPTTMWMPGEDQVDTLVLRVPAGLPQGRYRLTVAMFAPETNQTIMLGMGGKRAEGDYELTALPTVPAPDVQGDVFSEDFEKLANPWDAPAGLTVTLATGNAHSGDKSLAVEGSIAKSWNYASYRVTTPITPFALYRLTGWMLVERLEPLRQAPFLKLGVNAADGKWITNVTSNHYDTTKLGTWQKLEAIGEMPANAATVDIAIEKGDNSTPVTVNLRVDDLKLELVEGI
ncbi:MAG: carbohydrate binding domain-containing protein, partial [Armatimonadia bacterium]